MRDLALAAEVTEMRERWGAEEVYFEELDELFAKVIDALSDKGSR